MNNRDRPAMPTPDEYQYGDLVGIGEQGLTKHEAASLKILCSMLTARGNATDDDLITQASQIADMWLEELEVVSASRESNVEQQYKEFSKWCLDNPAMGLDPRLHTHAGRIEDGGYISHGRTSSAFKAWQASRQATEK